MRLLLSAVLAVTAAPFAALTGFVADSATGDSLPGFATLLVQLGLSGVFLWQWQTERKERAAVQHQLNEFLEKFAPVLADAINVLGDVKRGLVQTVERVQAVPDRNDYDIALRRMELLAIELGDMVKQKKQGG